MRKTNLIPLTEAFPDEDIFDNMQQLSFNPDNIISTFLNAEYFTNRSGNKQISPLVEKWINDPQLSLKCSLLLINRYQVKWENLFRHYSSLSTLDLLDNINTERKNEYNKTLERTGTDTFAKAGSETRTLHGEEVSEESYPTDHVLSREISGGYEDIHNLTDTRTGSQETTESFPVDRKTTVTTSGGYSDTDTTKVTRKGTETKETSFPVNWKVTKAIEGEYEDSDDTVITRTGTETTTESYPQALELAKSITGGYTDTSQSTNTKTGSEQDSLTGQTTDSVYGFNSSAAVPSSVSSPNTTNTKTYNSVADNASGSTSRSYSDYSETQRTTGQKQTAKSLGENGMVESHDGGIHRIYDGYTESEETSGTKREETSYGTGVTDEHSGGTSRAYNNLVEERTETGTRKTAVSYGDGVKDKTSGDVTRQYNNYKDEVTETGTKRTTTTFGEDGKTDTLSFNNRTDTRTVDTADTTESLGTITEHGYKYDSLMNEYLAVFTSAQYIDFLEIVFCDMDNVLTCPFYAV